MQKKMFFKMEKPLVMTQSLLRSSSLKLLEKMYMKNDPAKYKTIPKIIQNADLV